MAFLDAHHSQTTIHGQGSRTVTHPQEADVTEQWESMRGCRSLGAGSPKVPFPPAQKQPGAALSRPRPLMPDRGLPA